ALIDRGLSNLTVKGLQSLTETREVEMPDNAQEPHAARAQQVGELGRLVAERPERDGLLREVLADPVKRDADIVRPAVADRHSPDGGLIACIDPKFRTNLFA